MRFIYPKKKKVKSVPPIMSKPINCEVGGNSIVSPKKNTFIDKKELKKIIATVNDEIIPNAESLNNVTVLDNGLFSTEFWEYPEDVYMHIVSSNKMPANSYQIFFTEKEDQLHTDNTLNIHCSLHMINFEENNKFLIHKLKKYKKIINGQRYYYVYDVEDLINTCKNTINTINIKAKNPTFGEYVDRVVTYNNF